MNSEKLVYFLLMSLVYGFVAGGAAHGQSTDFGQLNVGDEAVNIPDTNLRAAVENALGKVAGAPITADEMTTLDRLIAQNANIRNLTGLEQATNLTLLRLHNNSISDLSPISGLTNLTILNLDNNSISNISTISELTNLTRLTLYNNSISDISAISELTNLTWLTLHTNRVSDISAISGLTNLTGLTLYNNNISDLSPLVSNIGLGAGETVDARMNPLNAASINTHIPILQGRGVEVVFDAPQTVNIPDANLRAAIENALGKASGAPITVADMETFTAGLTARDANISNLTGLEHATNLRWLDFINNNISDLSPISGLTNLTGLNLDNNNISDLSPLVSNTHLGAGVVVDVKRNPLNTASLNTHIPTLQGRGVTVYFDAPQTVNIPDANLRAAIENALGKASGATITVADMETFTAGLTARDANISNLTGLEHATNLRWLDFINNNISDLSPISGLTNLTSLNLDNNNISDLSPLVSNTNLGDGVIVDVEGNPLNTASLNTHIPTLQGRGVTVYFDAPRTVNIPDANLRAAVESALGKVAGAPITADEMATLGQLITRSANIRDLTGLEYATNLTTLMLEGNSASNLSPLAGLTNLRTLYLDANSISDITPLSELTNLSQLDLEVNSILNVSALGSLSNLSWLNLNNNSVSDLSPLVSNTGLGSGDTVYVRGNPLSTQSLQTHIPTLQGRGVTVYFDAPRTVNIPDANLRAAIETALGKASGASITVADMETLTSLTARDANISNLTGLEHATNLTWLDLITNSISDLSPISGLTKLTLLRLSSNTISNISAISGLTNLTTLRLDINSISNISVISELTNLTRLILYNNNISDLSPLVSNTGLGAGETVDVRMNPLNAASINTHIPTLQQRGVTVLFDAPQTVDIPDANLRVVIETALGKASGASITVADMETLTSLTARDANISNLTGLEHATNLTRLVLYNNRVSDISPLSGLTSLTWLTLNTNRVSDISAISGLANLTGLTLYNNNISDLSPLVSNTGLGAGETVDVRMNPLNAASINTHIPTLQQRGVTVLFDAPQTVDIPDANLRVAIETALGKASGAPITVADMKTLTSLEAPDGNISNLTGLEHATNLTWLGLYNNSTSDDMMDDDVMDDDMTDISPLSALDLSPLAGLTNLTGLYLYNNNISNLSPLAGLINLTELWLDNDNISNISPLGSLINLTELWLGANSISDISAVAGLTNLTSLTLSDNSVSDLSPLVANTGLGNGDTVYVQGNPLSTQSLQTHIPALQRRGVTVTFTSTPSDQTNVLVVEGTITNTDGSSTEAGLNVTVTIGSFIQTTVSAAGGGYRVTFINPGGDVASISDTVVVQVGRQLTGESVSKKVQLSSEQIRTSRATIDLQFSSAIAEYLLSVSAGTSLIHVPLKVTAVDGVAKTITSIGDLYDALGGANTVNLLITYDPQTQGWISYLAPSDKGTAADKELADDTGIIALMTAPVSLRLSGDPLGTSGSSTVTLTPGLNLVGVPLKDSRIARVSDLLALEGIAGNVSVIIVSGNGEFKTVAQPGADGDIPVTGGQSFILTAQRAATVTISGEGWNNTAAIAAAPLAGNTRLHPLPIGIQASDATPILALSGAIDSPIGMRSGAGFCVIVKNRDTGRAATGATGAEGISYQLTVVDMETGRAAMIGDTLEISAQSLDPFIGVQPLEYTVTAEDVLYSRIQLADLVAYEIPVETELLQNYPNPFNPETWIPYRLAADADVTLTIYDTRGQVVRTLAVGHRVAAVYERRSQAVYWDGRNEVGEPVASGVYFYHLSAGRSGLSVPHRSDFSATRRMLIIK